MKKLTFVLILIFICLFSFSQDKHKFVQYTAMELVNPYTKQYNNSIYMRSMQGGFVYKNKVDQSLLKHLDKSVFSLNDSTISITMNERGIANSIGMQLVLRIDKSDEDYKGYTCYHPQYGRCYVYIDYPRNQVQLRLKYLPEYDLYQFIFVFLTRKVQ